LEYRMTWSSSFPETIWVVDAEKGNPLARGEGWQDRRTRNATRAVKYFMWSLSKALRDADPTT
jgi:glycerol kinase